MMEPILYGATLVVYGIFLLRFALSWFGGDFELDSDADLDVSDVVSFKGFLHFLMGFTGWLSTKNLIAHIVWYDYIIAFVVGVLFIAALFFVYKLLLKLESKPTILTGQELVGSFGKIYLDRGDSYLVTVNNGLGTTEVPARYRENKKYKTGDTVMLCDYKEGYYSIV